MISEADALARILGSLTPLTARTIPLTEARAHRASSAVAAPVPLPRFAHSAMDGYALRAADAARSLRVIGEQPAGPDRRLAVAPGTAIRIFTGAPIPTGVDCVVRQEDVDRSGDTIRIRESPAVGEFLRPAGGDICAGQLVLRPGDLLTPARVGLLAALGVPEIDVHRLPTIGIISTGDELRPPGTPLAPGEIPDSNRPMLAALLAEAGFPTDTTTHARDTPVDLASTLAATAHCDAIVITGGVSVGEHDHVRAALRDHGVSPDFWRVAVKPGKPFSFGRSGTTAFFGLPGNPVSTFVTSLLFVLPALRRLAGATIDQSSPVRIEYPAAERIPNPGDRPHYFRGSLVRGNFRPALTQESHALASLAQSTHLGLVGANGQIDPGDPISCLKLAGF